MGLKKQQPTKGLWVRQWAEQKKGFIVYGRGRRPCDLPRSMLKWTNGHKQVLAAQGWFHFHGGKKAEEEERSREGCRSEPHTAWLGFLGTRTIKTSCHVQLYPSRPDSHAVNYMQTKPDTPARGRGLDLHMLGFFIYFKAMQSFLVSHLSKPCQPGHVWTLTSYKEGQRLKSYS